MSAAASTPLDPRIRARRLAAVVAAVMLIDVGITIAGQPAHGIDEGNPIGVLFLSLGKLAFVAAGVVYAAAIATIVARWRSRWGRAFGHAFMLGHFWGASTWIGYHFAPNVSGLIGVTVYGIVLALALAWTEGPADRIAAAQPAMESRS